ncbi:MAG: protein-L-isoaspartate(D-aspartate) O-methyltransferase [candidate division Zixibacteria bacterium]|nr:protein-L-isoaspartate(D-aspartate) O-methyltransferase [candidate division Zixibacteria bacterium]MDH3939039.1 protein-L-isoaspartate(D-aspartate) O-methyltransferase [candidate division Zixibacteria bacterium]MDH4032394.1 protein-L-isoaspartate(D-aspartate) O-methyltransferase [candidate division Zixibacteria bacterium]
MKKRRSYNSSISFDEQRRRMVDDQLKSRDITDTNVLNSMLRIPRHLFVPPKRQDEAYSDGPLQIGHGQTISQPYIVASMTQALRLRDTSRVLEIGTGCGYQTAILSDLAKEVYSVEVIPELTDKARRILKKLGCRNVHTDVRDGFLGWPERSPYDGIIVTAAAPKLPEPLIAQLAVGGTIIIPLTTDAYGRQFLTRLTRESDGLKRSTLYEVRFVPMVGQVEE